MNGQEGGIAKAACSPQLYSCFTSKTQDLNLHSMGSVMALGAWIMGNIFHHRLHPVVSREVWLKGEGAALQGFHPWTESSIAQKSQKSELREIHLPGTDMPECWNSPRGLWICSSVSLEVLMLFQNRKKVLSSGCWQKLGRVSGVKWPGCSNILEAFL